MKNLLTAFLFLAVGSLGAQAPQKSVIRLSPALDAIMSPDAVPEKIASGTTFFEGATWVPGRPGYLIFTDIPGNVINKLGPDGKLSVVVDNIAGDPDRALVIDTGINGKQK